MNPAGEAEELRCLDCGALFNAVAVIEPTEAYETVKEEAMAKESMENPVQMRDSLSYPNAKNLSFTSVTTYNKYL